MYSLLFKDLLHKCTMPPLVLAFDDNQTGLNLNKDTSEAEHIHEAYQLVHDAVAYCKTY